MVAIAALGLVAGVLGRTHPSSAGFAAPRIEHVTESAYASPRFPITKQQWATFALSEVSTRSFETARETDGQIAIDDDLSTPVFSPYTGRVTRVIAKAGDVVTAGQPLFAVEASEFVQAQNDLIAAVATLCTARAQMRMAQITEARTRGLFGAQAGAQKDWQQSQVDLATAQGNLESAGIALAAVRSRLHILGKSAADVAALENHPGSVTASPEVEVLAPISGSIIQRQIGVGQNIVSTSAGGAAGSPAPVYTIGDLSRVWLVANVREVDTGLIRPGSQVSVRVAAFPDRAFTAHISYIAPGIDPATRRLSVRAEIDNSDGALRPGMLGAFSIVTGSAKVSPAVPARGVVYERGTAYVWVADPEGRTLEMRQVRAGRVADGMAQITDGLRPGEQVVTAGAVFIDRPTAAD